MEKLGPFFNLIGRILVAALFLPAGVSKLANYSGMQQYMESGGVPGILLPLVILLEIGGGLALIVGWQTRIAAFLLAGFCVVSGILFHFQPEDQIQMILLMKNIAVAGGLLVLVGVGAGTFSLDQRRMSRD
ncbi:DoxX family protein [Sneathiella marina]|uniref:DoxX family protein n=1 Tax=Sneathiella marina TaxID=2950108 RepID=A0ABY4W7A6_9PROT|nr:DoxX family protein [Sneathiella marina]USG62928.1 DoxX family protein [Sneathiella marina]